MYWGCERDCLFETDRESMCCVWERVCVCVCVRDNRFCTVYLDWKLINMCRTCAAVLILRLCPRPQVASTELQRTSAVQPFSRTSASPCGPRLTWTQWPQSITWERFRLDLCVLMYWYSTTLGLWFMCIDTVQPCLMVCVSSCIDAVQRFSQWGAAGWQEPRWCKPGVHVSAVCTEF